MGYNLAELSQEDKDKMAVDQAASGVAFKERYNMPVTYVSISEIGLSITEKCLKL